MGALRAEWTKLRTLRSTGWTLGAAFGLTLLITVLICSTTHTDGGPGDDDVVFMSLAGMLLGQVAVVALAIGAITSEYANGTIRATFAANPRRRAVLGAKAAVVGAAVLAVGLATSLASFEAGRAILPGNGYTALNGYPPPSLGDGATLRAVLGTAAYLALVALLSLAAGVIVRHTAAAVSAVLALLYVPVMLFDLVPAGARDTFERISPMGAGHAVQTTVDRGYPIGPLAGLLVVAAWAAGALIVALWLIERRDA